MKQNGIPIKYIDIQGIEHDYTEADKTHAERQWLTVNYNDILWKKQTEPLYFYVNFKATKTFKERVRLALLVNKSWTIPRIIPPTELKSVEMLPPISEWN